jgi:3-phosphoshikimate 1-carboxyvinyltransferase
MEAIIKSSEIKDFTLYAPPSKSFTHRAYSIATLAEGTSTINYPLRAGDTDSTLNACRAFGAGVEEKDEKVVIKGTSAHLKSPQNEINVGNSGTTIRFFASISALDGRVVLTGDESIKKRPMQPLLDALKQLGVKAHSIMGNGLPPIEIQGNGIEGGVAKIRGDVSSQYISSILIASPYSKNPVTIKLTSPLKSRPYVDVTLNVMKTFGINVENKSYRQFNVPRGVYKSRDYTVEGDWSSSSYFLALAALSGSKVVVNNLKSDTIQGDRVFLEILKKMGADVKEERDAVIVEGRPLKGVEVDLGDSPDLLPTVAVLASSAQGHTKIKNISHARLKETDRVSATAVELSKFGVKVQESEDSLIIKGGGSLKGGKVKSHGDHRMVMALAILGAHADGETVIDDCEAINISYPHFFEILQSTGVNMEII